MNTEEMLRKALETKFDKIFGRNGNASRRALARVQWEKWCEKTPEEVVKAAVRQGLAYVEKAGEEERIRQSDRVEQHVKAALMTGAIRIVYENGGSKSTAEKELKRIKPLAQAHANASLVRMRRAPRTHKTIERIATSRHAKHVRMADLEKLEDLDEGEWKKLEQTKEWVLREGLKRKHRQTLHRERPEQWIHASTMGLVRARYPNAQDPGEGTINEMAQGWPFEATHPPLVQMWAHAWVGKPIMTNAGWDAALEDERVEKVRDEVEGIIREVDHNKSVRQVVEACAKGERTFEKRVMKSCMEWWVWMDPARSKRAWRDTVEETWAKNGTLSKLKGHPTQLTEHKSEIVWMVDLERPWSVLCAIQRKTVEEVARYNAIGVAHLHEEHRQHLVQWGTKRVLNPEFTQELKRFAGGI